MKEHRVGYIRVSSVDQNEMRQLDGMELDQTFVDKASGKDTKRPQFEAMLKHVRKGDTLVVHSMDRLARNLDDLRRTVFELISRGVTVEFVKERLVFTDEQNDYAKLMLSIMGAFAEFERSLIKERQREGIALAKKAGVYKGRKPALSADQIRELRSRIASGEKKAAVARHFKISRETLYRYAASQFLHNPSELRP